MWLHATWFALGMQLAAIRVLKWPKNGPKTSKIAQISWLFASFGVWHTAYVHPQRHITCSLLHIGPNVIICYFACIGDGTSLHTGTQMATNGQSA